MRLLKLTAGRAFRLHIAILVFALGITGVAQAQSSDSDTFNVTATVIDACIITANDHAFGNYSPITGSDLDATSTIDVTCTNGLSYDVELDAGTTSGGAISARLMTDSTNTLGYNLYTTSARTTVWGDGTSSSVTVSGTGNGSVQSLTVYGRVPASQTAPAGAYSDTVTATVNF